MTTSGPEWRVLVVDDDAVDRESVRRGLRRAGLSVDVAEAASGSEALQMLATRAFDCVFLDYNLPGSDGLTLLPQIRREARGAPVIALTGHGDERVAVQLMKAGAADYLAKSETTPDRLATSLRYATELARAHAQARTAEEAIRAGAARARFLAEASAVLTRSLDVHATLKRVAQLSVPIVADYCLIYLRDSTTTHAIASAHRDREKQELVRVIEQRFHPDPGHPTSGVMNAMRTGRVIAMNSIPDSHLDALATTADEREAYRVLAPHAALFAPLVGRTVFGVIVFCREADRPEFGDDDVSLAEDLASRAAAALESARLYQEAEQARRAAEDANRAKSEFLARMSHDLRTPLNAIAGYAQLIEEGVYGTPTEGQLMSLARIRRAQQHLLALINDVLSFAKLEAGQVSLHLENIAVRPALEALSALIEPQVLAKDLRLRLEPMPPGLTVRADRERMTQILLNLLTNAVKFTGPGGEIALSGTCVGGSVELRVSDSGRGIAADQLQAIFEPFVQASQRVEEERQGVGLGLAIGRELARMMHGELSAESEVGRGSTFSLILPAAPLSDAGTLVPAHEAVA